MKPYTRKSLALRVSLILLVAGNASPTFASGLPVFDGANLAQTVVSAMENVSQTLKQIQQYQTQLQQYENMLQNTAQPTTQIWDQATVTMNQLRGSIDTLDYYKANLGSIDAYLGKFKDADTYRGSPCYSNNGCTAIQWAEMKDAERLGSESQKRSTDALFKGLDRQQNAMVADANKLQHLQVSAQGATGQMQAIGYANQLASHQSNQLLQIRALLIAQQNVLATRNQALADAEAKQKAASDKHYMVPASLNSSLDRGF